MGPWNNGAFRRVYAAKAHLQHCSLNSLRVAKQNKSHFFCFGQPERLEFEKFFD